MDKSPSPLTLKRVALIAAVGTTFFHLAAYMFPCMCNPFPRRREKYLLPVVPDKVQKSGG